MAFANTAMSIPNHILEQLNSQADLVSIIGRHTTLKRSGNEFKGCCPFHGEKTPSFYVNPQKNIYHCFGCGVSGNSINFLREYENMTFMEAVQELSRQTGIEVEIEENKDIYYKKNVPSPSVQSPSQFVAHQKQAMNVAAPHASFADTPLNHNPLATVEQDERQGDMTPVPVYDNDSGHAGYMAEGYEGLGLDYPTLPYAEPSEMAIEPQQMEGNLYHLLERVQQFYQACLQQNTKAQAYFELRKLSPQTIEAFGLGYAPDDWQHLAKAFPQDIDGLKILGLIRESDKGREYDLLRARVIFPIKDQQGRTIGFAGRALDNEVKPKYINSSDSPVFHKQHVLYGYYESRQQKAKDWLVVEGYMDVIALYQAGIYGAVASMGTAINSGQIAKLFTLNPVLTLSFDGDSAGQTAAWRALEVSLPVLSDDKELRFLTLPNQHDPDTFIQEQGVQAMQEQINQAIPLSQYIFNRFSQQYDLAVAENKAKVMSQVRALTNQLPKGSSFRYLLNSDIYQRLNYRKNFKKETKDALLDFQSHLTVDTILYLCLLYQPDLVHQHPLQQLWKQSGILRLYEESANEPPLPSWQEISGQEINQLIHLIETVENLPTDPNLSCHFFMSSLPEHKRQEIMLSWREFYQSMVKRQVSDLSLLLEELLIQLVSRALQNQIKQSKSFKDKANIKQRWQQLAKWRQQRDISLD